MEARIFVRERRKVEKGEKKPRFRICGVSGVDLKVYAHHMRKQELDEMPELELQRLTEIYESRGLKRETAELVAQELTEKDALSAHVRDELGINEISQAKPVQAAFASGASFTAGGILPFLVTLFLPLKSMTYSLYGFAIFFLIALGALAARAGGSSVPKAVLRITFWGTAAMGLTALVGYIFNVTVG